MPDKILVIDDESAIVDTIIYALNRENFSSEHCSNGKEALNILEKQSFSLIILDVGLPDTTGFELCKTIRETLDTPIIFLTARDDEIDKILGLEIGADDYVTKPFSPRELVARVKTILKRRNHSNQQSVDKIAAFTNHTQSNSIYFNDTRLNLTTAEYLIIAQMMKRKNIIFSRLELLDITGASEDSTDRTIDTHIKSIRAKLKNANAPDNIVTHRGLGYSWSS